MPRALSSKWFWSTKFTELTVMACTWGQDFVPFPYHCPCLHAYVHTHIHTCTYTHTSTHMHTCVPMCTPQPPSALFSFNMTTHILLFRLELLSLSRKPQTHPSSLQDSLFPSRGSFPVPSVWAGPTFFKALEQVTSTAA